MRLFTRILIPLSPSRGEPLLLLYAINAIMGNYLMSDSSSFPQLTGPHYLIPVKNHIPSPGTE
jgi:hypothetical protein